MFEKISEIKSYLLLYFLYLIKQVFYSFDLSLQFFINTLFIINLIYIHLHNYNVNNHLKFICQILLIIIAMSILSNIIIFLYDILFYYGFVNTSIILGTIGLLIFGNVKYEKKYLLNSVTNKYTRYIISKFIKISYNLTCILFKLSDTPQFYELSNKFLTFFKKEKAETSRGFIEGDEYGFAGLCGQITDDGVMFFPEILDEMCRYKKYSSCNDSMDFCDKSELELDNLDDLDELDDIECVKNDKPNQRELNRAALKKKMAEKKAMRTGNMADIMPMMGDIMDVMMKGDNLEKIMKMAPSLSNSGMEGLDKNQLNNMMNILKKKL